MIEQFFGCFFSIYYTLSRFIRNSKSNPIAVGSVNAPCAPLKPEKTGSVLLMKNDMHVSARINPHKYWEEEYLLKVIAVGSGANILIHHFVEFSFLKSHIHTIGVDFATKVVKIGDQTIKLLIFVISGQKSFTRLRPYYYRGAKGAIVCYDITSWSTFKAIYGWLNEIYIHLGSVPCILVGNKMELANQREVPRSYAEAYAKENGLSFIEISTKTGIGVDVMFATLARMMLEVDCQFNDKPISKA